MKRFGRLWALLATCLALGLILAQPHAQGRAKADISEPTADSSIADDGAAGNMQSLKDALADEQLDDGLLRLDMDRLRAKFGCAEKAELKVYAATRKGNYEECVASQDGIVAIPAGKHYVRIECSSGESQDKSNVCWAGVIASDAPQALMYAEPQETQAGDEGLVLDLSEVFEACSSENIMVYSAREGKTDSLKEVENGVVCVDLAARTGRDKRYVTILMQQQDDPANETARCLWAGVFTYDSEQPAQRYVLRWLGEPVIPDWSIEIDEQEVSLSLDGGQESSAQESEMRVKFTFMDSNDEVLYAPPEATISTELTIPPGTVLVKAQLMLDGEVLDEKQLKYTEPDAPTPSSTPSPTLTPALRLDSETAEIQDGKITFSGTVTLENGGETAEWVLYVNHRPCEAKWTLNEDGSARFRVDNYPGNAGRLSISVRAADESTEFSNEVELETQVSPVRVMVGGWAGEYDGEPHTATATVLTGEQNVKTFFVLAGDSESAPLEPAGGEEGLPQATDAGTLTAYVRAEAEDRRVIYVDEDGNALDTENGWVEVAVEIRPAAVTLVSGSGVALYGDVETLTNDEKIQGTDDFCEGDYYIGDARAVGSQAGAGVSRNTIQLGDKLNTDNYELSREEGVLVIFPQSIDANAPAWSEEKDRIDPEQFADAENLPGYYDGMSVKLKREESDYDGSEKKPAVIFSKNGEQVKLTSEDYEVRYLRGGVETGDLVSAGKIDVEITGIGNYAGTVTLPFEIKPADVKDSSVRLESWSYDGTVAGSERHQPQAADGARFVYRGEAGDEIAPPSDAGSYTVQAVWDADGNYTAAESERCQFVIYRAAVTVILSDQGDIENIEDSSGQFREELLRLDGNTYVSTDDNFKVTSQWKGLRPGETPPTVALEGWEYDGAAAGSQAHQPEAEEAAEIHYLNEAGDEIAPPSGVGRYTIRAKWVFSSGEAYTDEQTFEISPRMATVSVCDAEKDCGAEDPIFTATVEGLLEGDEVAYTIRREAGEDVGEYALVPSGDALQGNYELLFESGTLKILSADIAEAVFEWFDDAPTLSASNGRILVEGEDYDLQIAGRGDGMADVTVRGRGNYSGELSRVCAADSLKAEVTVLDSNGEKTERIMVDSEDRISLSGELVVNRPVQAHRLAVWINGQDAKAAIHERSDGLWTFTVTDFILAEQDEQNVSVAVAVNGSVRSETALPMLRQKDLRVGLYWIAGLSVVALIHLVGFIRLSKRLKQERLKLLDRVSRQSNRTIRDNRS